MKKIKIFIAGSKKLIEERNCIKILANDMNSFYNQKDIMVIIHSYEHFNDKQGEYDKFIEEDADIVIFILDGYMGSETENEFLKATKSYHDKQHPEVIVFLHKFTEKTPEIGRIEGLLTARMDDKYYVDYTSLEDLKAQAKKRISHFIDNYKPVVTEKPETAIVKEEHAVKTKKLAQPFTSSKRAIAIMACIIVVMAGLLCWSMLHTSDLLIFAGGGSVKNLIQEQRGVDIVEYPHSVYANLASGSAWALLAEEANRYQEDRGKGQQHFSSICLSADNIDSTFINEKTKSIFASARIIRYSLGTDPLVIYVHKSILKDKYIPEEAVSISVDSLRSMVKYVLAHSHKMRLFTTSKTSGTLRLYQSCFSPADSVNLESLLDQKKSYLFYQKSTTAYINALDIPNDNQPYLILGSQYYYPFTLQTEKDKEYQALAVKKDGNNIVKPMNLYFVGLFDDNDPEYCRIKKPVINFLEAIHAEETIDEETWKDLKKGRKKIEGGNLFLKIN